MPSLSAGQTFSTKCWRLLAAYKSAYAEGWNSYVASASKAQSKATTETIKVKDSKEEKVSESETRDVKSTEKTTEAPTTEAPKTEQVIESTPATEAPVTEQKEEFIPVDGEEEVIEESNVYNISFSIEKLKQLKDSYLNEWANAYTNAYYEEQENTRRI